MRPLTAVWAVGKGDEVLVRIRDKWVRVRVSADEHAEWQRLAESHGMGISDLIRRAVGGSRLTHRAAPTRRKPPRRVDPELIRELGRIGSNLNQAGRWANTYKSDAEAEQILAALVAIERELVAIRQDHTPRPPARTDEGEDDAD